MNYWFEGTSFGVDVVLHIPHLHLVLESQSCFNGSGQIITTSAEVTLNGGLVRESPQNPLNSGLGIILICPDGWKWVNHPFFMQYFGVIQLIPSRF